MNPARLIAFNLLSFVFGLLLFVPSVFAQQVQEPKPDLNDYTQRVMIGVGSSLTCMLSGVNAIDPNQKCLGIANGKIGPVDTSGGAIGAMGNLIALTFTPPAHAGDYLRYLASNFGFAKPTYAQGVGFTGLSPILPAWAAFRNIVYLLFVLVFIVIGFAIMLRVKIDPRTVMTIENQIPKIIIALILVTFSFAIAGFLIDLMWVAIYLVYNVFANISPSIDLGNFSPNTLHGSNPLEAANQLNGGLFGISSTLTSSILGFFFSLFGLEGPLGGVANLNSIVNTFINTISAAVGIFAYQQEAQTLQGLPFVGPLLGKLVGLPVAAAAAGATEVLFRNVIPNLIVFLVISIAILYALLRLWFQLIMAYIFILIDIVFAPFWIIMGLVPGSGLTLGAWLRHIIAYLVSFPATIVIFLLGKTFIDLFGPEKGAFVPPLIGNPGDTSLIGSLIGFGIILTAPNIVTMMVNALKAPKFDIAPIFQAIGVGTGGITGAPGAAAGYGSMLFGLSRLRRFGGLTKALGYSESGPGPGGH